VPFGEVSWPISDAAPLRVEAILDAGLVARHQVELIRQIGKSGEASLAVVAVERTGPPIAKPAAFFRLYSWWDRRHAAVGSDPIELVDCPEELRRLRSLSQGDLDVVLDLRESAQPHDPPVSAKFGVWTLHYADRHRYGGEPEGFWEVYEESLVSGGELQASMSGAGESALTLARCRVATSPGWSRRRNQRAVISATNALVLQKLAELRRYGWAQLQRRASPVGVRTGPERTRRLPTNWELVRWLIPAAARRVVARLARPRANPEWYLAIRRSDSSVLDRSAGEALAGFTRIEARPGRWYADPFMVEHQGDVWAFFEDADRLSGHGRLSVAPVLPSGRLGDVVPVLERSHHLSYPHVFFDRGQWFMIPETSANGTVELWRCLRFPDRWTHETVLLRAPAVDSTLLVEAGRYWLFTTLRDPTSFASQLWLLMAEDLAGPWRAHPENPVSADVRNARGAGAFVRYGGRLYRPSQDGSGRYGRQFALNEVVMLSSERYVEQPGVTVQAPPGCLGTHSYAQCGQIEMIDVCELVDARGRRRRWKG